MLLFGTKINFRDNFMRFIFHIFNFKLKFRYCWAEDGNKFIVMNKSIEKNKKVKLKKDLLAFNLNFLIVKIIKNHIFFRELVKLKT